MTREELARIALRYDTQLSRAMLRALGVEPRVRARGRATAKVDRYEGIAECFAQRVGVS